MAEGNASTDAGSTGTTDAGNGGTDKTFTQADLDRIVGERIGRERAKYEGVDLDDLKSKAQKLAELEASQQTEAQKLTAERDTYKTNAEQAAAENLRLRVAAEKKLPVELMDRLRGGTEAEMKADADKLLELVSPTPSLDGGTRTTAAGGDFDSMIRRAAGRG